VKTTQNRVRVLATILRASTTTIRRDSVDEFPLFRDALECIDTVAEELEQLASAPDPAEVARG
jgi:uncharacterized protein (UPF0305 family)